MNGAPKSGRQMSGLSGPLLFRYRPNLVGAAHLPSAHVL